MSDKLREQLAEYAHEAWSGWMRYMLSKGEYIDATEGDQAGEHWLMPAWGVTRWERQMKTPYADLPESEKESDRAEADKMLAITQANIARDLTWHWQAGEVCFDCPCGEKEIIISEGGETHQCECGRTYRLVHYVEVEQP